MPDGERELIESLGSYGLEVYKKQLRQRFKTMSPRDSWELVSRFQGVKGMEDLVTEFQQPEFQERTQPLWRRGLETATAPLRFAQEKVAEPLAAGMWSAGVTLMPGVQSGEREFQRALGRGAWSPWHGKFMEAYKGAETPWGVKGALETAPWFLIPGPAGVTAKLGALGAKAGVLGTAARIGAKTLAPIAAVEKAAAYPISKPLSMVGARLAPRVAAREIPESVTTLTKLVKEAKPLLRKGQVLRHEELQRRAAKVENILKNYPTEEAFPRARAAMRGELPKPTDFTPPTLSKQQTIKLRKIIHEYDLPGFTKINADEALLKVFAGQVPEWAEIALLEHVFGREFAEALIKKGPLSGRIWDTVLSAAGLPKAMVASFDLSAPLRQGAMLIGQKEWWSSWKPMIKSLFSEKYALDVERGIVSDPLYGFAKESGLALTAYGKAGARLIEREEPFMTQWAKNIPWVKLAERTYVTYLNKLRADTFYHTMGNWLKQGMTKAELAPRAKSLALFINAATGRGTLAGLNRAEKLGPLLNAAFFSPRFVASRFQAPFSVFSRDAQVRNMVCRNLAIWFGGGIAALSLLKQGGATVELDPRSTDFGKGKIGNTRIDFWAGYQPIARYMAQFLTEERKTLSGATMPLDRKDIVWRFIQSKMSPTAGLLIDALIGENFIGEPMGLTGDVARREAFNRLVPMFVQDLIDATREQGLIGVPLTAPAFFGAGVQTYPVADIRDTEAKVRFGKGYGELSPSEKGLIRNLPEARAEATTDAEKESVDLYESQLRDDEAYQRGEMSGRDWRERMYDHLAQRAWRRKQWEGEYPAPTTPEEKAQAGYYQIFENLGDSPMPDDLRMAMEQAEDYLASLPENVAFYVEENRWPDATPLMKEFKEAQKLLKPYWNIQRQVWANYPPEYRELSDRIKILEGTDPVRAKLVLIKYPQIMWARKIIAQQQKMARTFNPEIKTTLNQWY